jgi:hypothetical protein
VNARGWRRAATLALYVGSTATRALAEPAPPAFARLEHLDRLIASAEFASAQSEADALLATGTLALGGVVRVHIDLGVIAAARGDRAQALEQFRWALRLQPNTALGAAVGPNITALFDEAARDVAEEEPLAPALELTRTGGTLALVARLAGSGDGLVGSVHVRGAGVERVFPWQRPSDPLSESWELGARSCGAFEASVLDTHGNVLWPAFARLTACTPAAPMLTPASQPRTEAAAPAKAPVPPPVEPSSRLTTPVWIGIASTTALTAATIGLGIAALNQRSDYQDVLYDPNVPIDRKWSLREDALAAEHRATVCGAVAVAAAGVTAAVFFLNPPKSQVRAAATWSHSTAGLRVDASF